MEQFVLAGKAKIVFQIIELMAKGEELDRQQKKVNNTVKEIEESTYPLWPSRNERC